MLGITKFDDEDHRFMPLMSVLPLCTSVFRELLEHQTFLIHGQ